MNVIIIPAYQPDFKLIQLTEELFALHFQHIIVIDDGSKAECSSIFEQLEKQGCHVLHHPINQGKGAAIKTGIQYAHDTQKEMSGYVTCDADGQHPSYDIWNVSKALEANPTALILGSRDFSQENVPKKSRLGNRFSSFYFKMSTGVTCHDTQTGLRGIPIALTSLALDVHENRYDYEMTFLTRVAKEANLIIMIPISTVYLDSNSSSHFRPIIDSIRIYRVPLKFALSSIVCAIVDIGIFSFLSSILPVPIFRLVFIATISARVLSGLLNFVLNRVWSFRNKSSIQHQFLRYLTLYAVQLLFSVVFVSLLSFLPIHLTLTKILVDSLLFIGSFFIQKNWVFRHLNHPRTK